MMFRDTARWTGGAEASGAVLIAPPPWLPAGVPGAAVGRTVLGADRCTGVLVAGVPPVAGVAGPAAAEGRPCGRAAGADVPLPGAVLPGVTARCTGSPVAGSWGAGVRRSPADGAVRGEPGAARWTGVVGRLPSEVVPEAGVAFGAEPCGGTGAVGGVPPGADGDRLPAGAGPVLVRAVCGPCGDTARCTGRPVA